MSCTVTSTKYARNATPKNSEWEPDKNQTDEQKKKKKERIERTSCSVVIIRVKAGESDVIERIKQNGNRC